jgi:uncharacterized protein YciI
MEFFVYHRDRPGSLDLRHELIEAHWSYMDRYAAEMIARGPTFADGGETLTGSVHILDLPDPAAARAFAFDEPNYQAGAYRDVLLRRWRNLLGRTMWDFPGGPDEKPGRHLILAHAKPLTDWPGAGRAEPPLDRDRLIAFGRLLSEDGEDWEGTAVIGDFPDPEAIRALFAATGAYDRIEVHPWTFGGRR